MGLSGSYNVIKENGASEIVVTKSRFIGNLVSVSSAEEAEEFITSIRKKYNDARHNCWAYIVIPYFATLSRACSAVAFVATTDASSFWAVRLYVSGKHSYSSMNGFILLYRSIFDHWVSNDNKYCIGKNWKF